MKKSYTENSHSACLYSLGMYEKALPDGMSLEDKMLVARDGGYDHVEFCVDLNPDREARLNWTETERHRIRELSERMLMPFTTFSLSLLRRTPLGLLDGEKNKVAFRVLDEACSLAVDLGSRVMLVNGYDVYDEPSTKETAARFFENLPIAVRICERYGIVMAIENAEMPFCAKVSDAVRICRKVPSPFLQVYGDIGNSANACGGDAVAVVSDLMSGKGILAAMHLKDSIPGEYRFRDYGKGHVDFARCIEAAKRLQVRLFTAEIFCDESRDPVAYTGEVAKYLRSFF